MAWPLVGSLDRLPHLLTGNGQTRLCQVLASAPTLHVRSSHTQTRTSVGSGVTAIHGRAMDLEEEPPGSEQLLATSIIPYQLEVIQSTGSGWQGIRGPVAYQTEALLKNVWLKHNNRMRLQTLTSAQAARPWLKRPDSNLGSSGQTLTSAQWAVPNLSTNKINVS